MNNKLKIQIKSFVKGGNHGQYLQALGLKALVEEIIPDAQVSHLNYNNHARKEFMTQLKSFHIIKYFTFLFYWNRRIKFTSLNWPDISIYGSDMIWHLHSNLFLADKLYFGENDESKKIAYAPSTASREGKEPDWLGLYLNKFLSIGVRDQNTFNLVKEHSAVKPEYVIDPCFFLLKSKYIKGLDKIKRTERVGIYSNNVGKTLGDLYAIRKVNKLKNPFNKIELYGYFPKKLFFHNINKQLNDPLKVIYQIAKCKILITTTFHGVMMALMTKTPFIAIKSPNLVARLNSPIKNVFGTFRLISTDEFQQLKAQDFEHYLTMEDFNFDLLTSFINASKQKLSNALNNCTK